MTAKPPIIDGSNIESKRAEIKRYFNETGSLYESLFQLITEDSAFYLKPEPLRHPLIFYFGHTATFYVNKLILGKYISRRINHHLESICAVGVDEMSWDDLDTEHYQWPAVDEVRLYRNQVNQIVNQLIDTMPLTLPMQQNSLAWVILMGIEHERIHVETSSVIMRMLDEKYLNQNSKDWAACTEIGQVPLNELIPLDGKTVVLGKNPEDKTYGWDNEYGTKTVAVEDFRASKYLVSNQEFLQFVQEDGYTTSHYWTEEGKKWLQFSQASMPRFWSLKNGIYYQRNLINTIELPLSWPVEVNYLEAHAFCQWKSEQTGKFIRLPTEAEWMVLRDLIEGDLVDWQQAPGNVNLEYYASSCPVNKFEQSGFFDIVGNVWQWTESFVDGYDGFSVHPLYDDFSTPTFDGLHNLFKGGSWISTGNEACKNSRYGFRRHFFQHAGFRYIESSSKNVPVEPVQIYQQQPEIVLQLHSHYGESVLGFDNYHQKCAEICLQHMEKPENTKLLELGCSVGRTSFELARKVAHVDAIDSTARLIQNGFQLQEQGQVRYVMKTEGELQEFLSADLAVHHLNEAAQRVHFSQSDLCNLKPLFKDYHFILLNNILTQVYDPKLLFEGVSKRLLPKGILAIASDYEWNEDRCEPNRWLGGRKINGETCFTLDALSDLLEDKFERLDQQSILATQRISGRRVLVQNIELSFWRLKKSCSDEFSL